MKVETRTKKEIIYAIALDFKKFAKKVNELNYQALEGDCPQPIKMLVLKKITDEWYQQYSKSPKDIEMAEDFYNDLIKLCGGEITHKQVNHDRLEEE